MPTVYIKSTKPHYTNICIRETGCFIVNIPNTALAQKTDYVGLVSGHDTWEITGNPAGVVYQEGKVLIKHASMHENKAFQH